MPQRYVLHVTGDGTRLDHFLAGSLPEAVDRALSRSVIRRLIRAGAVRVNWQPSRQPAAELRIGDQVDVLVRSELLPAPPDTFARAVDVLFEDRWLLAVDKPAGVP